MVLSVPPSVLLSLSVVDRSSGMASCVNCGQDFAGSPWHYVPAGRAHVNCQPVVRDRPAPRARPQLTGPVFAAQYPGTCSLCRERYRPGTMVTRLGHRQLAHQDCATRGALTCGHDWPTAAELDCVKQGLARMRDCRVCRHVIWHST